MGVQSVVQVRLAEEEDAAGLCRLYVELAGGRADALPASVEVTARVLAEIAQRPDRWLLVAELVDGEVVGTVDLMLVPKLTHDARPWAIVENVVVAEANRRQGVGQALMQEAMRRARSANCYKLQLVSGKERGPAHEFYRALGMEAIAEGFKIYFED
jgi:GNAT superfamily N-acetyltransferase